MLEVADEKMEEAEQPQEEEDDDFPMFQEHYNALFSMEFVETKYPHDNAMKALGIFDDVQFVLKNMHLARFFSHRMESYKELTCEFLASLRYYMYEEEDRANLDQGLGWITFLVLGVKRMVTFRQLEILFGFNYGEGTQWRSPVLRYVHKALSNTFFARKATGTINEGELRLLDMGIKPILSYTNDGRKIRGDTSNTRNRMPFLDQLLTYKTTAYNTRFQQGRKLSIGGLITPILCAVGVNPCHLKATPPGWMDIKFCKTNLLIDHKVVNGKYQSYSNTPQLVPPRCSCPTLRSQQSEEVTVLTFALHFTH
ncbi:unnamed protein product [Microthlaspi erraticum]|uniref:Arabidopsis retrotransposon Orf1 C-terminal domain-containing protein n=1 Tax=Microthlaspi erraticum TaxID=1685480 RepID=A0A6D2ID45_9BRAS|nr:unnamed protein product [Microthlaspi erraticum]